MILLCRVTRPKSGSGLLRPGPQTTLPGWSGAAIFGLSSSPSSVRCSVWKSKRDLWLRFLRSPLGSSQRLPGEGEVSTELSEMKRWVGEGEGDWVAEGDSQMIVQRRWNLASFHTWAHAQNGVVGNSPQTIAVWHQATPFCSLLLLPTKQNASKFYPEPQTWELTASGKGGGEQLSAERSLCWAVSPKCRNHVEVVWFLFHFNHQSQRKTNNVHVPRRAAAVLPCSMLCLTPGCLSARVGTGRQTLPLWSAATMPQSSCLQFVHFLLSQTTKMENNRRVGPASLCDLDKERSPGSLTSKWGFLISAEEQTASSSVAQSVLLWNFLRFESEHKHADVLFLANQQKVICQNLHVILTDAPTVSWLAFVRWTELLVWSGVVYLRLWGNVSCLSKKKPFQLLLKWL